MVISLGLFLRAGIAQVEGEGGGDGSDMAFHVAGVFRFHHDAASDGRSQRENSYTRASIVRLGAFPSRTVC